MRRTFLGRIDFAIVGLTILAWAVASYRLGTKSLWLDEAFSADFARHGLSGLGNVLGGGDALNAGGNGGLYFVLLNLWGHIFGYTESALRSLTVLVGGLTVPVIVLLGTRLFGRPAGLLSGLLLALSPFFVHYEQTARTYALVVALVTLSSYFFVCELEQPSRGTRVGFVVSSALAFYAHDFAPFVLVVQAMTLLAVRRRAAFTRYWLLNAAAIAILCVPEGLTVGGRPVGTDSTSLISLTSELAGGKLLLIALLGLGAYGLVRAIAGGRRWPAGFVAAWFLVPVLLVFAISKLGPTLFVSYYLIVSLPALFLLAAAGLVRLPGRAAPIAALGLLIVGSAVGMSDWYRKPAENDYRAATHYVLARAQSGDEVVYYPWWLSPGFAYYEALAGRRDPSVPAGTPARRIWLVLGGGPPPPQVARFIGAAGYAPLGESPASVSPSVFVYQKKPTARAASKLIGPNGLIPSAVAACLRAAGARPRAPAPAGPGTALYAVTPDGAVIGIVKAPNVVTASLQQAFIKAHFQTEPITGDATAFGIYKGQLTGTDAATLRKCTS